MRTEGSVILALGADPGASTGLALVSLWPAGARLLALWSVHGSSLPLWWARASAAAQEARELAAETDARAWVEAIPATMREGSIAGVTRGHAAWAGLGQRRGLLMGALMAAGWPVEDIDQRDWTAAARVQASKQGIDPRVRLREAAALVAGAGAALDALPSDTEAAAQRQIDAAEAVLIALGAAVRVRGGLAGAPMKKPAAGRGRK